MGTVHKTDAWRFDPLLDSSERGRPDIDPISPPLVDDPEAFGAALPEAVVADLPDALRLYEELVRTVADELGLDVVGVERLHDGEEAAGCQVGAAGMGGGRLEVGQEGGKDGLAEDRAEGDQLGSAGQVGQDVGQDGEGQRSEVRRGGGVGVRTDFRAAQFILAGLGGGVDRRRLDVEDEGQDGIPGGGGGGSRSGDDLGRCPCGGGSADPVRVGQRSEAPQPHGLPIDAGGVGQHGRGDGDGLEGGRLGVGLSGGGVVLLVGDEAGEGRRGGATAGRLPGQR